jgi:aldehyde dehydrogenase family 7 protein A1
LSALDLPVDSVIPGVYDGQWKGSGEVVESKCPATGEVIGRIRTVSSLSRVGSTLSYSSGENVSLEITDGWYQGTREETQAAITASKEASLLVRRMPGPKRGEIIRQIREAMDAKVGALGDLVSLEMGKIKSEGKGEVQEVSDSLVGCR